MNSQGLNVSTSQYIINLFINSDAILNRDPLWSIQGKKKQYLQAAIVGGITIQEKYCDNRFLSYNGDFMPSVCTYGVMNF